MNKAPSAFRKNKGAGVFMRFSAAHNGRRLSELQPQFTGSVTASGYVWNLGPESRSAARSREFASLVPENAMAPFLAAP